MINVKHSIANRVVFYYLSAVIIVFDSNSNNGNKQINHKSCIQFTLVFYRKKKEVKNAQQVRGSGQHSKGALSTGEAQHTEDKVSSDWSSHVDVVFSYRHLLCNW